MSFSIQEASKVLAQKFLMQEGIAGVSHQSRQITIYIETPEMAAKIPSTLMGFPVKKVVTGRFYKLTALPEGKTGRTIAGLEASKTTKWRPAPGGVSVGHYQITAGTLSTRVYDTATKAKLFLSNNHVLANCNQGKPGDPILQPGPYDGGADPADRIGTLERFVEIKQPPDTNLVDAAVGKPLRDTDLSDEVLDIGVVTSVEEARVGMTVAKSGRTTCYKTATITDVNATVKVWDYPWGYSIFEDQILTTYLGAPGDSGSLCVNTATKAAVGLLFAGSDTDTVLNKMTNVVKLLNINFGAPPPPRPAAIPMISFLPMMLGTVWFGSNVEKGS